MLVSRGEPEVLQHLRGIPFFLNAPQTTSFYGFIDASATDLVFASREAGR